MNEYLQSRLTVNEQSFTINPRVELQPAFRRANHAQGYFWWGEQFGQLSGSSGPRSGLAALGRRGGRHHGRLLEEHRYDPDGTQDARSGNATRPRGRIPWSEDLCLLADAQGGISRGRCHHQGERGGV